MSSPQPNEPPEAGSDGEPSGESRHKPARLEQFASRFGPWLALGLAIAHAAALVRECGRVGFMPLDQSICFDGGWRILSGEVPLRDYVAPNGFTVHALQALFFAVGGVNWSSYIEHAALMNALAAGAVWLLLRQLGLGPWLAALFAGATGVVFFTPFGAPYMDTHAFAFSLAALVAALRATLHHADKVRRREAWLVGPLLALAFFSKQIPSVFFLVPCLALCALARTERVATLRRMLLSLAATAFVLLIAAFALGVDFAALRLFVLDLPAEEGARRLGYIDGFGALLRNFDETRTKLALHSILVVHLLGLPALALGSVLLPRALREPTWRWRQALGAAALGELLLLACLGFIALTSNDREQGVPLVFAALGACAAALVAAGAAVGPRAAPAGRAAAFALAALALWDAWGFHERVNIPRKAIDITFAEPSPAAPPPKLPDQLACMQFETPRLVTYGANDLRELSEYLRVRDGAFFLVGDASVLYGITGKPSVFPALWFHPGLTFPYPHDARFAAFEQRLLERLERFEVRTIVLEPRVWIGYPAQDGQKPKARYITLESFPRVAQLVNARLASERSFGPIRVLELR